MKEAPLPKFPDDRQTYNELVNQFNQLTENPNISQSFKHTFKLIGSGIRLVDNLYSYWYDSSIMRYMLNEQPNILEISEIISSALTNLKDANHQARIQDSSKMLNEKCCDSYKLSIAEIDAAFDFYIPESDQQYNLKGLQTTLEDWMKSVNSMAINIKSIDEDIQSLTSYRLDFQSSQLIKRLLEEYKARDNSINKDIQELEAISNMICNYNINNNIIDILDSPKKSLLEKWVAKKAVIEDELNITLSQTYSLLTKYLEHLQKIINAKIAEAPIATK